MASDPFYRSLAWREARAAYIRTHPTCEVPTCSKPAKHVDHKRARRAGGASLDPANFMALCHSHHSEKTARRDGGFGHAPGAVQFRGCDAAGWPIDPNHPWRRPRPRA